MSNPRAGMVSICVGRRGTGKTTFSKELLSKTNLPIVVYDINQEYTNYYNKPFDDFKIFLEKIVKLQGHYILIEEATIFFDISSRQEIMKNLLVRARHTGNFIHLNFHSFATVPKSISDLVEYITVFKTNDAEKALERFGTKDSEEGTPAKKMLAAFKRVTSSKNEYAHETLCMYN